MSARPIRWLSLLASLLLLCGLVGGGLWLLQPSGPAALAPEQRVRLAELTAARQRWMTAGLRHYRLKIEHTDFGLRCQTVAEIRDTTIVVVEQSTCPAPPPTVDDLFRLIERHTSITVCGPNGCSCDGPIIANATYDSALGYPQQVSLATDPSQRTPWPMRDRLRHALQGGGWGALTGAGMSCTLIGMEDPQPQVLGLTPLP